MLKCTKTPGGVGSTSEAPPLHLMGWIWPGSGPSPGQGSGVFGGRSLQPVTPR